MDLAKGLRTPREFESGGQWGLTIELTQDWGSRLLEGTNKTLGTPEARRKEQRLKESLGLEKKTTVSKAPC